MRIAVQASDLDRERVDGTRVYLKELLKAFGVLAPKVFFVLYHERAFSKALAPTMHSNYQEKKIPFPIAWMQTRFAWTLFRDVPEKLFLPIQAAPLLLPRTIEVTATIHDLAWKKYPETFTWKDRLKLDILLRRVIERADKLIAVSEATKEDVLQHFP
ncbi:MAG: glycosyltransferase, partial [Patescibacteria group bacterium]